MPREGVTIEIGEPSSLSGLSKDLSSSDPQLGKGTKMCLCSLFFIVITDIDVMVAKSTRVAQVEDLVASIDAEAVSYTHLTLPTIYSV